MIILKWSKQSLQGAHLLAIRSIGKHGKRAKMNQISNILKVRAQTAAIAPIADAEAIEHTHLITHGLHIIR